jgi:RNA polymerase sigma factor (sigma-70 family)
MSALAVVTRPTDHDGDDLDLVAGVRAGDDRAFEALYWRYQPRITAYVRGMVHDHGRAEDITQEVFMSALRRMRQTSNEIAFKPWIYEIAKNACIDAWRRSRNTNEVSFDAHDALGADDHGRLAEPGMTPDAAVDAKDAIDNLCGAFGGLSRTHHEILVMREFEGLSYREIGERLGMSRPGVESTLFRARRRLSEEYEELVSGERCLRVQRIIDTTDGRAVGLRDQRRMARHISHCQPCRRHARLAGFDLDTPARPATAAAAAAAGAAAARIAALAPLPLRRRYGGEEAGHLIAQSHSGPAAQWSATIAGALDPATVSGWSKALATAATVAVAGAGAGAAIRERGATESLHGPASAAAAGHVTTHPSSRGAQRPHAVPRATTTPSARARATAGRASGRAATASLDQRQASPSGGDVPVPDVVAAQSATTSEEAGATAPAVDAGHAAPTGGEAKREQTLARVLDKLGAGVDTTTAATAGAPAAPSPPSGHGVVGRASHVVADALGLALPTSSTTQGRRAASTEMLASVGTTVTDTLDTMTAGPSAP